MSKNKQKTISNKPYSLCENTLPMTLVLVITLIVGMFLIPAQPLMAAMPSASTIRDLSQIHDEIDALPIAPEVRQQMLLYIEIAESRITSGNMGDAREAVLDFCRRIEWYRYQIGHNKIDKMFNQAMGIAVELHNAALG